MSTLNRLVLSITLGLALLVLLWPALPLVLAAAPLADCLPTVTVTSTGDSDPGSLRQALAEVCSGGTIDFDAGLAGQPIVLTTAELTIANTVTITNPHASGLQISGDNARRVFNIQAGAVVTLSHLSIISGTATEGGGIYNRGTLAINHSTCSGNSATAYNGGGIYNSYEGVLTVNHSTFSDNSASSYYGGGIYNNGTLTVNHSTFNGNSADGGGGIYNYGTLMVDNSTFNDNSTTGHGGGINNYYYSTLEVNRSTFSGNSAWSGGGINSYGKLTVKQSTFNGNSASYEGSGISNNTSYPLTVENSVFSDNSGTATSGGAIYNYYQGTLTVNNSTFNGNSADLGGSIYNQNTLMVNHSTFSGNSAWSGGGIENIGTLTVDNCSFNGNSATTYGGGINNHSYSTVDLHNSIFSGNSATAYIGGAIYNNGTLRINNSIISDNSAADRGGGIYNENALTVNHSTFSNNSATSDGGGIYNGDYVDEPGTLEVKNSTFSNNNSAGNGGGIANFNSKLTVNHSTFSGNSATEGGGILNYSDSTLYLSNSILANSPNGGDCVNNGTIDTNLNTLIEDGSCSPVYSGDPLLAPLADYGGSTLTFALLPGSPAIDAGDAATCLPTDQRGIARPQGGGCDIGAFESQGFTLAVTGGNHQAALVARLFAAPLGLTVTSQASGEPVDGGLVTFTAPGTGPSVTFAPTTTLTIAGGAVSLPVKANLTGGAYPVSATAAGANQVTFSLTNTPSGLPGVYLPLVVK